VLNFATAGAGVACSAAGVGFVSAAGCVEAITGRGVCGTVRVCSCAAWPGVFSVQLLRNAGKTQKATAKQKAFLFFTIVSPLVLSFYVCFAGLHTRIRGKFNNLRRNYEQNKFFSRICLTFLVETHIIIS